MSNAKNTENILTAPAPKKALAILRKGCSLFITADYVSATAARKTGSGAGWKGDRHNTESVQLLKASLDAGKLPAYVDTDKGPAPHPMAAALSFAVAISAGHCRWILAPSEDGTWTLGHRPLAPVEIAGEALPANAATIVIPPCGAFRGGLEVVAPDNKGNMCLWRMVKGEPAPVVKLAKIAEGTKGDTLQALATACLVDHLAAHNQGGAGLVAVAAMSKEGGK